MTIPIFWHLWRGNWDCSLLRKVIEGRYGGSINFEEVEGTFEQHKLWNEKQKRPGGIVIFGYQENPQELIGFLNSLDWFIFIYVSDECNRLDFSQLPKHGKIWTQCWTTAQQPVDRHLLLGWRYDTEEIIQRLNKDKKYLWSFVGQVQAQRVETFKEFEKIKNGKLVKTTDFGGTKEDGLPYEDYLQIFCNSKIVLCPMGNNCADSFRLYEALEAGALPIVEDAKYWEEFKIPFPCVEHWAAAKWIIHDYELHPEKLASDTEKAVMWWREYKRKVLRDLEADIKSLC